MKITKFDATKIAHLLEDGLVELTQTDLNVTPEGMLIVRNVAVAFDPKFEMTENKFSTTI
jgi:coproporphyrinogen III oxidase-like Fe-S oxidoreductase